MGAQVIAMLRSLKELERYTVNATDGDLGSVANFLFDDEKWAIRYLVVKTGNFFDERRVLVSPISFRKVDWAKGVFHLALTMDQIKGSPGLDADRPVSRQHERNYSDYYGYPYYWGTMGVWGSGYYPALLGARPRNGAPPALPDDKPGDVHLRSAADVRGYDLRGTDDGIGFVADFIVDDETWELRYLVVDTSHWWWGKKVLVAPDWATQVSWSDRKISLDLTRDAIKNSPEWNTETAVGREYETRLYGHYGRKAYWPAIDRPAEAIASRLV
jgi:hypothetical protein